MASRATHPVPDAILAFVAILWLGMVVGISFLATPVKFEAPSLDLPVALEIGRVTFATFTRVEWGLCLLLVIAVVMRRVRRAEIVLSAMVVLTVAVQAFWLLPVLDARVDAVIAGQPIPPSMAHIFYGALEAAKAVMLAAVAFVALFRLGWPGKHDPSQGNP